MKSSVLFFSRKMFFILLLSPIFIHSSFSQGFTYHWSHPSPQGNSVYGIAFKDDLKGWAVTGCGNILETNDSGQSWQLEHETDSLCNDLYDIVISSQGTLITSGDHGRIMRSTDEGESWTIQFFPGAGRLYDLALVPGGGISAAGENGVLLVSDDNGISWNDIGPGGNGYARHHAWKSETECYLVGFGMFYRTTDAGSSWSQVATPGSFGLNEVFFLDENIGYALEDFACWKTTDGGNNWVREDNFIAPLYRFRTIVLGDLHWLTVTFVEGGELWETTDGGLNWENKLYHDCTGFLFLVQNGSRILFGSDLGDIFYTDDAGGTSMNAVQNLAVFPSAPITVMGKRPDGTLFANNQPNSGIDNGSFYRSDDDGASWHLPVPSPGLRWVTDLQFYDDQYGVLGSYGDIRYTTDGGDSWNVSALPEGYNLANFALPATDRFFAGTYASWPNSGGNLYKSADHGETWQAVGGGLPFNLLYISHVSFATADVGYLTCMINNLPEIYKTTDGGENWIMINQSGITGFISDMVWLDENTGIAAVPNSDPYGIYRTTNGGLDWSRVSEVPGRNLTSGPDHNIAAVDTYDTFFQESTDDGLSWVSYTPPFSSAIAGNPGYVYAVQATEKGYIIGGTGNRLIVAERIVATGIEEDNGSSLSGMAHQNLSLIPNPVNDHADIRLILEQDSYITLSLFDAQGRLVHVFRQQFMPKGIHLVPFDAGKLKHAPGSGIYFVTLQTGNSFNSVKMILAE